jgi:hypothetical protein
MQDELKIPTHFLNLTDNQLIVAWKTEWMGTQSAFSKTWLLNQGNFSRWLQGRRSMPSAANAIRRFLSHHPPPQIKTKMSEVVIEANRSKAEEELDCKMEDTSDVAVSCELPSLSTAQVCFKLAAIQNGLSTVVLIDGDSCARVAAEIDAYKAPTNSMLLSDIHVVVTLAKGKRSQALNELLNPPRGWLTIVHSGSNERDAADLSITIQAMYITMSLPNLKSLLLVSYDHFAKISVAEMQPLTRVAVRAIVPAHIICALYLDRPYLWRDVWLFLWKDTPQAFGQRWAVKTTAVERWLAGNHVPSVEAAVGRWLSY